MTMIAANPPAVIAQVAIATGPANPPARLAPASTAARSIEEEYDDHLNPHEALGHGEDFFVDPTPLDYWHLAEIAEVYGSRPPLD